MLASEKIRLAIEAAKAKKLPVVVSMANLAASGGYWVSTPADMIFAEPSTITGSIGIFGVIPSAEAALAKWGVTADGVKTTPLSGEPDVIGGFSPEFDRVAQSAIENGYQDFLKRVAVSRRKPPSRSMPSRRGGSGPVGPRGRSDWSIALAGWTMHWQRPHAVQA